MAYKMDEGNIYRGLILRQSSINQLINQTIKQSNNKSLNPLNNWSIVQPKYQTIDHYNHNLKKKQ